MTVGRIVVQRPGGVLGDHRGRRAGDDDLAAAADGLGDGRGGAGVGADGGEHDDEVEAAGPAGQGGAGPRDERHRAGRLEHGAQQARVGPGGDHRPRAGVLARRDAEGGGLGGAAGLAAHARAGLGERAQPQVGRAERDVVVEAGLVEPGHPSVPVSPVGGLRRPAAPGCRRAPGRRGRSPGRPARSRRRSTTTSRSPWQSGHTMISSSVGSRRHAVSSLRGSGRARRRASPPSSPRPCPRR